MSARYDRSIRASRSRLVSAAKVVLPLIGLALLSTMFLISDRADPEAALPYAEVDVDELAAQPRLSGANYATVTEDGTELSLRARKAVPDLNGKLSAEGMELIWQTREGMRADLIAEKGVSDPTTDQITLSGGITMTTSTGYRIITPELTASTDRSVIVAPQEVRAAAPFGQLTAGSMRLEAPETGAPHVLHFTDGVRLIYKPEE